MTVSDILGALRGRYDGALVARFIAEGATKALSLVTVVVLTRLLAVDGFGAFSQVQALSVAAVPVVTLGIGFGIVRRIAGTVAPAAIAARLLTAGTLVAGMAMAVATIVWLAAPFAARYVLDVPDAASLLRAAALLFAASAFQTLTLEALRARQRAAAASALQIGEAAAWLAGVALLAAAGGLDALGVVLLLAVIRAAVALLAALHLIRREALTDRPRRLADRGEIRHALAIGLPFVIVGLGDALLAMADRLLVGASLGADMVGRYAAAQMLTTLLASWGAPFWWLLYPRLAAAPTGEGVLAARRLLGGFAQWGVALVVALGLGGATLLPLVAGAGYDVSPAVVALLAATVFVHQAATPWEYSLYIADRATTLVWTTFAWGLAAVALTLLLLPQFGLAGAAAATLLARLGFAATVAAAAARIGHGAALLPVRAVLLRIALALAIGLAATVVAAGLGVGATGLHDAIVFLVAYVVIVVAASRRQAERRAA